MTTGIVTVVILALFANQAALAQRKETATQQTVIDPFFQPSTLEVAKPGVDEEANPSRYQSLASLADSRLGRSAMAATTHESSRSERFKHVFDKGVGQANTQNSIPSWADSFDYQGLQFRYHMVGTDPNKGSKTTVIPTVLVPLRFVFPNGQVFDASTDVVNGQTPVHGILNSPIFQPYDFVVGGTHVGVTQYGDAFQRANFWDLVSTRARNYHVLLGNPTVLPSQTITVPDGMGWMAFDTISGQTVPVVNYAFLATAEQTMRANLHISPQSLPIQVRGLVAIENSHDPGQPGAIAWHGAELSNGGLLTFIATSYGYAYSDVYPLSHEVAEWMDDPFGNSYSAGWNFEYLEPIDRCDSSFVNDLLEVADPVEIFPEAEVALPGTSPTYHVTDAVFRDFFTRRSRSRSVNGQYSMFEIGAPYGIASTPSTPCTGHIEIGFGEVEQINYPGAQTTIPFSINNFGEIAGYYGDGTGKFHGFVRNRFGYRTIDYPAAQSTFVFSLNDVGVVAGYFIGGDGFPHGFTYKQGSWTRIDYPGSTDTGIFGINNFGDLVGAFDLSQPITTGFIFRNGIFEIINSAVETQSLVAAINNFGVSTGSLWSDPSGPYFGFVKRGSALQLFNFPGAQNTRPYGLNNSNDLCGVFQDPGAVVAPGFITLEGQPHSLLQQVFDNNDKGQIVGRGYLFDETIGDYRFATFVGSLPLASP